MVRRRPMHGAVAYHRILLLFILVLILIHSFLNVALRYIPGVLPVAKLLPFLNVSPASIPMWFLSK